MHRLSETFDHFYWLWLGIIFSLNVAFCQEPEYLFDAGYQATTSSPATDATTWQYNTYRSGSEYPRRGNPIRRRPSDYRLPDPENRYGRYDQWRTPENEGTSDNRTDIARPYLPPRMTYERSRPPGTSWDVDKDPNVRPGNEFRGRPETIPKDPRNPNSEDALGLEKAINVGRNRDVFEDENIPKRVQGSPDTATAEESPWSPSRHRSWKIRHMQAQRDLYHNARSSAQSATFV